MLPTLCFHRPLPHSLQLTAMFVYLVQNMFRQQAVTQSHGAIHGYKAAVAGLIKDHACTAAQLPPSAFR